MNTEDGLIPFDSTDLCGNRVLVLAPHPDDETIGCGGSLALHTEAGDPVKVIFLTNGAKGDTSGKKDRETYMELRQKEAREACASLGVTDLEFWSYEDRALAGSRGVLVRLLDLLRAFLPDLVYVSSPLEFHPDHRATCFQLCDAIRTCDMGFQVAFYEVGQPLTVNVLVDITRVIDLKKQALYVYKSQLEERDYADVIIGLNRFRSLTLPKGVSHAEGFSLWQTDAIKGMGALGLPFQKIGRLLPEAGEAGPLVSIIVRTRDRPGLLANALRSIAQQTYANLEIIVVNDGGQDVKNVVTALAGGIPVTYVAHQKGEGRSAAANSGLRAARGVYLNFLDDDDLFYPNHIETLVSAILSRDEKVVYSSVLSTYFKGPPENSENCLKKVVNHNIDFDPDRILFQNYIPIMSVLFDREVLSKVEGFSQDLSLFEDWDFWIRVSRHFRFHHVDRITAEYRFYGAETTEESHQQKYRYSKAQAEIFDRISPFLKGEIWTKFLENGLFERLGHDKNWRDEPSEPIMPYLKEIKETLDQTREKQRGLERKLQEKGVQLGRAEMALNQTTHRLKEAHGVIEKLRAQSETADGLLEEIFSSRGWLWLSRYRALKLKLGFNRARKHNGSGGRQSRTG